MPVAPFQARSLERETSQDRVERAIQARQGVRSKKALRGRCVGSTQDPSSGEVHVLGSVTSQLAHAGTLEEGVAPDNVRYRKITGRGRRNLLFLVDTSGSMLSAERLSMVKGCVTSLLQDAYQKRTRVAIVSFGGAHARLELPFTSSAEMAARRVEQMRGGGSTPLIEALGIASAAMETVPDEPVGVVLLSDGRYNRIAGVPSERLLREFGEYCAKRNAKILLVDAGHGGRTARKRAALLARALHAQYRQLADLRAEELVEAVAAMPSAGQA